MLKKLNQVLCQKTVYSGSGTPESIAGSWRWTSKWELVQINIIASTYS